MPDVCLAARPVWNPLAADRRIKRCVSQTRWTSPTAKPARSIIHRAALLTVPGQKPDGFHQKQRPEDPVQAGAEVCADHQTGRPESRGSDNWQRSGLRMIGLSQRVKKDGSGNEPIRLIGQPLQDTTNGARRPDQRPCQFFSRLIG